MGYKQQTEKEIREAYIFLREKNQTIASETLQFMLDASLEKLNGKLFFNKNLLEEAFDAGRERIDYPDWGFVYSDFDNYLNSLF